MHYYQHNVGDYRKDTAHLTLLEHGIYRQLLDTYYLTEKPLTANLDHIMRTHSVRTADESQALKNVLDDFFELSQNGYIHSRCEAELYKIRDKSDKAKQAANARWSTNKCKRNADAYQTQCDSNANGMLPNTQYPIEKNAHFDENAIPDSFTNFWKDYPKKADKKKAEKAWSRLSKKEKLEAHDMLSSFIDSLPEYQRKDFNLHATTYLNNKRWLDVIEQDNVPSDYAQGMI